MDEEVGCTLGMMLLKTGDSSNIYSARSKVFSLASAEPPSLLLPTINGYKKAMWHTFLMLNSPCGHVCA